MKTRALLFLLAFPVFGGEYAVLDNGFRIHADRHEVDGASTRLFSSTGSMDLPTSTIVRFEQEEYVPPKPQPAAVVPGSTVPNAVPPAVDPKKVLTEAAAKNGLRPEFVRSVAAVESAFQPDAVSPKGAIGLMQLMPGTAAQLGADPKDPIQNADAGTRYLKELLLKYKDRPDGVRLALAAYNAGPGAVDKYGSVPPYRETSAYVERVVKRYLKELNNPPSEATAAAPAEAATSSAGSAANGGSK